MALFIYRLVESHEDNPLMTDAVKPGKLLSFCTKCGSGQFKLIGDRSRKCSDCGFHIYFNTSSAVAALIFDKEGRVMFVRRAIEPHKGMLDLPGGFVEPLETAEQSLARELEEELGAKVNNMTYFCSFPNIYPFSGMEVYTLDMAFIVELGSLEKLKPMDDISAIEFYDPKEVNMEDLPAESMKNIIKKLNERG
jgi:NADH pyrophosphatase NudC (nudix superfamily)